MGVALSNGTQENPSIIEQAGKPILDGAISHISPILQSFDRPSSPIKNPQRWRFFDDYLRSSDRLKHPVPA
jgi:hypothetical protein